MIKLIRKIIYVLFLLRVKFYCLWLVWVCLFVKYFNIIMDGFFYIWVEIILCYNIMMYLNCLVLYFEGECCYLEILG